MSAHRRAALSERDIAVLRLLLRFRLMTITQLQRVAMTEGSELTRSRRMRAVLQRLCRNGVVDRLDRHIGGIRAGSEGAVYRVTGRGIGMLNRIDGTERRRVGGEPGQRYIRHVVAISEQYVRLSEQTRDTTDELLVFDPEPTAWRSYPGSQGGIVTLRPDAFVHTASGDYEHASFVEIDLATESLTTIARKCRTYIAYWQSGVEQRRLGVFPRVVWVVPDSRRHANLLAVIGRLAPEHRPLFVVTTDEHASDVLLGRLPVGDGGQS